MERSTQWIAEAIGAAIHGSDVSVTGPVVTDSREVTPGALYVARRGESADGHGFLSAAYEAGARVAIVEEHHPEVPLTQLVVPESTEALGELARAHLADLRRRADAEAPLLVIGLTGSAGKTTTKDLLRQVLSTVGPTVAPKLSFNNEVGLPLTVLKADETTRYLVLEMGASGPGHIDYLTRIAPVDIAIELMVGHAHMGGFGSIEGVAAAKAELLAGLVDGGIAILNRDDDLVAAMAQPLANDGRGIEVRYFSPSGNTAADLWADNAELDAIGRPSFTMVADGGTRQAAVTSHLVGAHHVANLLAAGAAAYAAGLSLDAVAQALSEARAESPHRMDVRDIVLDSKRVTVIDDSYNANLDSMGAAFRALADIAGDRPRVAVLGEMLELGESTESTHREVGQMAAGAGVALMLTVGESDSLNHYRSGAGTLVRSVQAQGVEEAVECLRRDLPHEAVVLIKGSLGSGVHKVADALIEVGQPR